MFHVKRSRNRGNVRYPRKRKYLKDSRGSSYTKTQHGLCFGKDVSPESTSSAACGAATHSGE